VNQLLEIIFAEIKKRGAISFEEFMRMALYCPVYGYYEKEEDMIGRNGDFYTSVSVGNLFGELLAFHFAEWLAACQSETPAVQIVEAGAHRGELARDILIWLRNHRLELFQRLKYLIIEPSLVRQKWQAESLSQFSNVQWLSRITSQSSTLHGIIFSNELLDAMPVRRFGWNARSKVWVEWGVTLEKGQLAWTSLDHNDLERNQRFLFETDENLLNVLPDGFTIESRSEAEAWWQNAARALERGKLMTIDYGMTQHEILVPRRKDGTLRGYYRHHPTGDLLANPGEQDLTAHVNFSELIAAGEKNGLKTETFETQSKFLTRIVAQAWKGESVESWSASRARQFQTLTHPQLLGRSFHVLVQSRD
jgi:SAM-dependent MidA family methyltransferase